MEFKTGIFYDVENQEYHEVPAASRGVLHTIGTFGSEKAVWEEQQPKTGDAFEFGICFHLILLEPGLYTTDVVHLDMKSRQSKAYNEWKGEHPWVPHTVGDERDQLIAMESAALKHNAASKIMADDKVHTEVSVFWIDEDTGVKCKARLDLVKPGSYIADLKSTRDASPTGFQRQMSNLRYDLQPAWYMKGWNQVCAPEERVADWFWVCVEKSAPHLTAVYRASENIRHFGAMDLKLWLPKYKAWKEQGVVTGYSDQVQDIELARWDFNTMVDRMNSETNRR